MKVKFKKKSPPFFGSVGWPHSLHRHFWTTIWGHKSSSIHSCVVRQVLASVLKDRSAPVNNKVMAVQSLKLSFTTYHLTWCNIPEVLNLHQNSKLSSDIVFLKIQVFWNMVVCSWTSGSHCFKGLQCPLDPIDKGTKNIVNMATYLPSDIKWHVRRLQCSATLLWEPQTSQQTSLASDWLALYIKKTVSVT